MSAGDDDTTALPERSPAPAEVDGEVGLDRVLGVAARMLEQGALVRYDLREVLGEGGSGEVRSGVDGLLRREVAIKRIKGAQPDEVTTRRFLFEAQVTGQLEHPNIVPVHDLGVAPDGTLFFTMRRVRGRSLYQLVKAGVAGSRAHRLQVFLKICDAVGYAHARGVVHRDLKPGNVMVGDHGEVLVLDWGLAKLVADDTTSLGDRPVTADRPGPEGEITSDTSVVGTPAYMAPEQALGRAVDTRTDVYSLGALLYVLLTGNPPFDPGPDLLSRVAHGRFPRPRQRDRTIPVELDATVQRAMALVPTERYQTVADLSRDVEAFLDGREVSAVTYRPWTRVAKWTWRHRRVLRPVAFSGLAAAGLLAAATGVYAALAIRTRDRAVRAEHAAEVRLAESHVALGLAFADHDRVVIGKDLLRDARTRLANLGESTLGADLAASWVEHRYPRPLVSFHAASLTGALAPDGRTLMLGTAEGASLWAIPEAARVAELPHPAKPGPGPLTIYLGERPVAGFWVDGRLEVYDMIGGAPRASLSLPDAHSIGDLAYFRASRSGDLLLGASSVVGTHVFAIPSGEVASPTFPEMYTSAASPDLTWLYGRTPDPGPVPRIPVDGRVVERRTGRVVATVPWSSSVELDEAGRMVVGRDHGVDMVDLRTGRTLWTFPTFGLLAFANDATEVVLFDELRALWLDADTGEVLRELPSAGALARSAGMFETSRDGRVLAVFNPPRAHIITAASTSPLLQLGSADLFGLDLSHDGLLLLVASHDGTVRLLEAASGTLLREFPQEGPDPGLRGTRDVAFALDPGVAYAADRTGAVRVLDLRTGELRTTLPPLSGPGRRSPIAMALEPRPDGSLVVAYEDGRLVKWDVEQAIRLADYVSGLSSVWDVESVPGTDWLAVSHRANADPWMVLLDERTGQVVARGEGGHTSYRVAARAGEIALGSHSGWVARWAVSEAGALRDLPPLVTGPEVVMAVAWHPDGRTLGVGTYDGRIQLWDAPTASLLVDVPGHRGPVADIAFDPVGRRLVTASERGEVAILEIDLASRLDDLIPEIDLDRPPADLASRLVSLATANSLRKEWTSANVLYERAAALGADLDAVARARALWTAGRADEARPLLDAAARDAGSATLEIWRDCPDLVPREPPEGG